jgi:hypothetical protein
MRITFAVAAILIVVGLAIALGSRNRAGRASLHATPQTSPLPLTNDLARPGRLR